MKIIAKFNTKHYCIGYALSDAPDTNEVEVHYQEANRGRYSGQKYDPQKKKWLEEYDEELRNTVEPMILPDWQVLKVLEDKMIAMDENYKRDTLLILRTLLEAVDELTAALEGRQENGNS